MGSVLFMVAGRSCAVGSAVGGWGRRMGFVGGRGWQLCPGNEAGEPQMLEQQQAGFLWDI